GRRARPRPRRARPRGRARAGDGVRRGRRDERARRPPAIELTLYASEHIRRKLTIPSPEQAPDRRRSATGERVADVGEQLDLARPGWILALGPLEAVVRLDHEEQREADEEEVDQRGEERPVADLGVAEV